MKQLTFISSNNNKVREVEDILGIPLTIQFVDIDEIQEADLKKVALHKLNEAYRRVKKPVLIDDVGVYIHAWNNFPGPLIKWILKAGNGKPDILLKMLKKEKNRSASVILAIGFHDGKVARVFFGEVSGTIALRSRGENGFGWDSVFIPEGKTKTYSEMSREEKNMISHRKKALDKLKDFLIEHYDI